MKQQTQIGWFVSVLGGSIMFFDLEDKATAYTYCEDGAEPVAAWANTVELAKHDEAQGDS